MTCKVSIDGTIRVGIDNYPVLGIRFGSEAQMRKYGYDDAVANEWGKE